MRRLNKFVIAGILLLILIITLLIVMQFYRQSVEQKYQFNTSSTTVIKELRSLDRLETTSFTIEKVIDAGTKGNDFQQVLFGDRILLIAHGNVVAGFDLSQLSDKAIHIDGRILHMTLPPPQILSTYLDSDQTRVYDRRQGLLSRGDKNLETEARMEAESIIRKAACDGGILNEATKNGRTQLTTLFKALGFTTVVLEIPSGSC